MTAHLTSTWQERRVSRAARCFSGVTPAQQAASTESFVSGRYAFSSRALDTTQMSVQTPTSSISSVSGRAAMARASATLPKVGFS